MDRSSRDATASPRPSFVRWCVMAGVLAVLVWGATWVGPVAFYASFQKTILAQGADPVAERALWGVPEPGRLDGSSSWQTREEGGVEFRVPPGEVASAEATTNGIAVQMSGGASFVVRELPPGFVGLLYRAELEKVGGGTTEVPRDPELLETILATTPDDYEFAASGVERARYAARLLTKLLIVESRPMTGCRLWRAEEGARAVLETLYTDGSGRLVVVEDRRAVAITLPPGTPEEWRSTVDWLPRRTVSIGGP